jgi:hypothetical protein
MMGGVIDSFQMFKGGILYRLATSNGGEMTGLLKKI